MEAVAKAGGYFVFFQTYEADQEDKLPELFMGRVDGILLLGQALSRETVEYFTGAGIPIVSVTEPAEPHDLQCWVDIDWMEIMLELLRHLDNQGHRRIAFMTDGSVLPHYECRFQAFIKALSEAGLRFYPADLLEGGGRFEQAKALLQRTLEPANGKLAFSALVCANDLMAAGSLAACRALGVDVPGTLAIAGCEDILMSSQTAPPLTAIRFPRPQAAEAAARMLLTLMEGQPIADARIRLHGELVVRSST